MKNKYLLVTPVKNEAENLPQLFNSIISQTIRPILWLIIDDGSCDGSTGLIKKQAEDHHFIIYIRNETKKRDLAWHYHSILSNGFKYVIDTAKQRNIEWNYIGVLDGDIFFQEDHYYEYLINEFDKNDKLGICSGGTKSFNGKKYLTAKNRESNPNGCARLILKECYYVIGEYPVIPAADSMMNKIARNKGYHTKRFEAIYAYQSRLTNAANGLVKGAIYSGHILYYLGYNIIYILLYSIKKSFKYPYITGMMTLLTYFSDMLRGKEKCLDKEIIKINKTTLYDIIKRKCIKLQ